MVPTILVLILAYTLVSIVITLLKGKYGMALLGLLIHPVWWFTAWPLAKPTSAWAHWFYDPEKLALAWRAYPPGSGGAVPPGHVHPNPLGGPSPEDPR